MKVFLLHADQDFDLDQALPPGADALTQDLELDTLLGAMSGGDQFLEKVAQVAVLCSLTDLHAIRYRQDVLADCLEHPAVVRDMYDLSIEALLSERKIRFWSLSNSPERVLHRSVEHLKLLVDALRRLRSIADEHATAFGSEGFERFYAMLADQLDDAYFDEIDHHLERLAFKDGVLVSARLGKGAKGDDYVLRRPLQVKRGWKARIALARERSASSFQIADRDENGMKAVAELRDRGLNLVANALAQSTDHILSFFAMLRVELGFFVGCLNLHERLAETHEPVCVPDPEAPGAHVLSSQGLCDVALTLTTQGGVVANDLGADGRSLVMITGANQGGKSTFLRAIGLAQLMMKSGLFVTARSYRASVGDGLFTHFKREEDATMTSGKLDEELARMSAIADTVSSASMLLCNESFASTNEREGSEIARQIVRAMLEAGIRVVFVTHLYDLAHGFFAQGRDDALFLRAERGQDGRRTFKLVEGEPLPTSYGRDLFERIFATAPARGAMAGEQPAA